MANPHNYICGMCMAFAALLRMMVWNACMGMVEMGSIKNALQLFVLYNNLGVMFEAFGRRKQGYGL